MRKQLEDIEKIERYLLDEMSPPEKEAFETEMQLHPHIHHQVEEQRIIMEGLELHFIRNEVQKAESNYLWKKKILGISGGLSLLTIVIAFSFSSLLHQEQTSMEEEVIRMEKNEFLPMAMNSISVDIPTKPSTSELVIPQSRMMLDATADTVVATDDEYLEKWVNQYRPPLHMSEMHMEGSIYPWSEDQNKPKKIDGCECMAEQLLFGAYDSSRFKLSMLVRFDEQSTQGYRNRKMKQLEFGLASNKLFTPVGEVKWQVENEEKLIWKVERVYNVSSDKKNIIHQNWIKGRLFIAGRFKSFIDSVLVRKEPLYHFTLDQNPEMASNFPYQLRLDSVSLSGDTLEESHERYFAIQSFQFLHPEGQSRFSGLQPMALNTSFNWLDFDHKIDTIDSEEQVSSPESGKRKVQRSAFFRRFHLESKDLSTGNRRPSKRFTKNPFSRQKIKTKNSRNF